MKVLVTGGAGFLGSHLVDALANRGHEVLVMDNLHRGRLENLGRRLKTGEVTLVKADIRDYPVVLETMRGVEVVYHLAAQSNVMGACEDLDYSFTTNVVGTFNVLKAASALGVRRVIFSSSREVYGEPEGIPVREDSPLLAKNPYGASKVAGEAYCRTWANATGLDCYILRFANIYGDRDHGRVIPIFLNRSRLGHDLELYGGQQILDFVWVGQAVEALTAAAHCQNSGPVNVGSGRGTSLVDLAHRIISLTGGQSNITRLPARDVEVVRFVADVGRMRNVLGVEPKDDPLAYLPLMSIEGRPAGTSGSPASNPSELPQRIAGCTT